MKRQLHTKDGITEEEYTPEETELEKLEKRVKSLEDKAKISEVSK